MGDFSWLGEAGRSRYPWKSFSSSLWWERSPRSPNPRQQTRVASLSLPLPTQSSNQALGQIMAQKWSQLSPQGGGRWWWQWGAPRAQEVSAHLVKLGPWVFLQTSEASRAASSPDTAPLHLLSHEEHVPASLISKPFPGAGSIWKMDGV